MIDFTVETDIERPVNEVFAYVTDPAKLAGWQTNTLSVEVVDGEPLALGSRLREVHRGPGGRELHSLVEVSELERDRTFTLRMLEGQLPIDGRITFEQADRGTRMRFAVSGRPRGAMRVAQPLLRVALRRQFKQHCQTLKSVLESS